MGNVLSQYADLVKEQKDLAERIASTQRNIENIERRLQKIEAGEVVKDKVYGGEGGIQGFVIEGVPTAEYETLKTSLLRKKLLLEKQIDIQREQEEVVLLALTEVEEFITRIEDSHIRRIVRFRVVDGLTWKQVAHRMGGGNTEDGVRITFSRFVGEKV
jgi:hypothetical protein